MAIKPILFNTEMVRAILDGRKTETRRVMKPQPWPVGTCRKDECNHEAGFFNAGGNDWMCRRCGCGVIPMRGGSYFHSPFQRGDILYVRETWGQAYSNSCYANNKIECPHESCDKADGNCFPIEYVYKADGSAKPHDGKWHPSIHMPKEAARIWLKVIDVRVERLHDIKQIRKEGIKTSENCDICVDVTGCVEENSACGCDTEADAFAELWDSTIRKSDIEKYGWDANPWVWVIEFARCDKPESKFIG